MQVNRPGGKVNFKPPSAEEVELKKAFHAQSVGQLAAHDPKTRAGHAKRRNTVHVDPPEVFPPARRDNRTHDARILDVVTDDGERSRRDHGLCRTRIERESVGEGAGWPHNSDSHANKVPALVEPVGHRR